MDSVLYICEKGSQKRRERERDQIREKGKQNGVKDER